MTTWACDLVPLDTAPLFRPLLHELLELLRDLDAADWERPTLAGTWRVRDVAAHLLDGDLRKLSACRDGHLVKPEPPIRNSGDLARFIHAQNAIGVGFGARLSARAIVDLLETTGEEIATFVEQLDANAPAMFAVSWAGETESANWMDTGREYTERWHHQAQIRDAVGAARLLAPRWMEPLLDVSVRALKVAYANQAAPDGTVVSLEVHGPTPGAWSVAREEGRWRVVRGRPATPSALVRVATDDVWRIFYNAVRSPELVYRVEVEGAYDLARPLLNARSVIV